MQYAILSGATVLIIAFEAITSRLWEKSIPKRDGSRDPMRFLRIRNAEFLLKRLLRVYFDSSNPFSLESRLYREL